MATVCDATEVGSSKALLSCFTYSMRFSKRASRYLESFLGAGCPAAMVKTVQTAMHLRHSWP